MIKDPMAAGFIVPESKKIVVYNTLQHRRKILKPWPKIYDDWEKMKMANSTADLKNELHSEDLRMLIRKAVESFLNDSENMQYHYENSSLRMEGYFHLNDCLETYKKIKIVTENGNLIFCF